MQWGDLVLPLLYWYAGAARALPWRTDPTPYHVWISEIMLQQTRVEAVKTYYSRFVEALPDPAALAAVDDDVLNKLWQGLGYYSRAKNLKKAAAVITDQYGGALPDSYSALRALPGIGAYTAGAIASIAFGLPEPAVDGNVLRVITRLTRDGRDILKQSTKDAVTEALRAIYPTGADASALTQALMELGATVCVPNGAPHCRDCPLKDQCLAHACGDETSYPKKAPKRGRTVEKRTVLLITCGGRYLIRRRPETGLLSGLWEFPGAEGYLTPAEASSFAETLGALGVGEPVPLTDAKHIFTHIEWHMHGYLIPAEALREGVVSASPEEIREQYCIPSAFRAYLAHPESEYRKDRKGDKNI